MKTLALACALLFIACSQEIEIGQKSGILFLKNVEIGLDGLKDVSWDVGKEREVEISKGLRFEAQVPKMSEQAAKILWEKYGVDSWIYKITKINRGSRVHLGYVAVDSKSSKHITESFTIHLYYHAASVSREFRRFKCPAFDHRQVLIDYSIKESGSNKNTDIYARATQRIGGDVSRLSFSPLIFSGGGKLEGQYLIEIALYNSKEKRLYSDWTPLSGHIEVSREGAKRVQSCVGVKEELNPLPGSRAPRIEDLQMR